MYSPKNTTSLIHEAFFFCNTLTANIIAISSESAPAINNTKDMSLHIDACHKYMPIANNPKPRKHITAPHIVFPK